MPRRDSNYTIFLLIVFLWWIFTSFLNFYFPEHLEKKMQAGALRRKPCAAARQAPGVPWPRGCSAVAQRWVHARGVCARGVQHSEDPDDLDDAEPPRP